MIEEWRPVVEFPKYEVSSLGRVKNLDGSIKKLFTPIERGRPGRPRAIFGKANGKAITRTVSRVVCEAFHGPPPSAQHQAAHKNGNHADNRSSNLRWATPLENCHDKYIHGTHLQGEDCSWSILTDEDVRSIRAMPKNSIPLIEVANKYGVSYNTVAQIRMRTKRKWPHIPFPDGAT